MQPVEIALFVIVAVLAVALIVYAVRPYLKSRRAEGRPGGLPQAAQRDLETAQPRGPALVCPACHRDYAPGLRFCPHDARELIPATDPIARGGGAGVTCPTCKRSFEAGRKFCAFDGDELVPLPVALGAPDGEGGPAFAGSLGKICPSCSRRYESDATFCGRDGSELVSVN
ncbi:MAG TPA: hypothetical protein VMT03_19755 [Polyangia bacterium]|nr:hypothetical protein [Polyangia bacterium]